MTLELFFPVKMICKVDETSVYNQEGGGEIAGTWSGVFFCLSVSQSWPWTRLLTRLMHMLQPTWQYQLIKHATCIYLNRFNYPHCVPQCTSIFLSICNGEIRIIKYKIIEYYDIQYNINIYEVMGKKLNYNQVQGTRTSWKDPRKALWKTWEMKLTLPCKCSWFPKIW